ncbi:MAG: GAF domain-containing protein [Desulfobacteraceae bacterium]|nr:MAG: GAF domain-containing protein [Desulfobacteraceae bacterium]
MWTDLENLFKLAQQEPWAKRLSADKDFWLLLMEWMEQNVLSEFLKQVIRQVDEVVEIDPDLSEPQILEKATQYIVGFLKARSGSVRIYDPHTEQMLSYGSYPSKEEKREPFIPLEGSVAGDVVKSRKPCLVPNILGDKRYQDKEVIERRGVYSLMAIPLEIARFFPHERDTVGVIQIYYPEKERTFTSLEIQMASLMAKRLSFVIAHKKILSMHRTNEKKEAIVGHIFRTLGSRGGIKMTEVFNRVIPELADMVSLQSCTLFSITEDLNHVVLEAGYPDTGSYHTIGKSFPVSSEPAFELLVNLRDYSGESVYEIVTPSYVLVADPEKSSIISDNLKRFAAIHGINSILYIPLTVDGEVSHFMTFDALDQRQRYRDDEIDIILFLGRELMKAQKMERLDDTLHDFKNPAIATAGFARRLKTLLNQEESEDSKAQIRKYVDILFQGTSRLQELALSVYEVGKEQVVSLRDVVQRRFEINKEAIREQLRQNIALKEGPFEPDLKVRCYVTHLERVLDNLLNNATKAIPLKGGLLAIRTYADGQWACAEISNSGHISEEDRLRLLEGEGEGRGLYITYRVIRLLKGKIEIQRGKTTTTFLVRLPINKEQGQP